MHSACGVCYDAPMTWTIAGLGNPGEEYTGTRHNVGRAILELFAKREGITWREDKKSNALAGKGEGYVLVLPNTYMNASGSALTRYIKSIKGAQKLLVVYDDLDLPVGRIKISFDRSSGGHNGLKSIERALKTRAFWRVRVGVAGSTASGKTKKPAGEEAVIKFILGKFSPAQRDEMKKVQKRAIEIIDTIVAEGAERAMNQFN